MNVKYEMFEKLSRHNLCVPICERIMFTKMLCCDEYYRCKLINETELLRKVTKRELNMILPMIWQDKRIDHTRVVLLLQVYKNELSDKIINSLKIDEKIKKFYLNLYYIHIEENERIDILNKLDQNHFIPYKYCFDPEYGKIRM